MKLQLEREDVTEVELAKSLVINFKKDAEPMRQFESEVVGMTEQPEKNKGEPVFNVPRRYFEETASF